jgi:hypothetical protein
LRAVLAGQVVELALDREVGVDQGTAGLAATIIGCSPAFASFIGRSRPRSENTFSVAFSRMWQVLRMTMSAPSGLSARA